MDAVALQHLLLSVAKGALAIAVWGVLFLILEWLLPSLSVRLRGRESASWLLDRRVRFFKPDFLLEFSLPLLNQVIGATLFVAPLLAVAALIKAYLPRYVVAPYVLELPFALQILYAMLVMDLAIYAEHRFAHRFAWPFHAVHHAAREVTWLTAFRIHPGNSLTLLLFNAPIAWLLGIPGPAWVAATTIVLFLGMFQHANLNWDWGFPFRYLLVSPNFHKWHHVKRADIGVKNLCLVFPFIDVLFGTFYFPRDERPTDFGIYEVPGEEAIGSGLLAQLWYPFGCCFRALKRG